MAVSNSMFLFEIEVGELKSYIDCKEFYIKSQFADVFTIYLKCENDLDMLKPKMKTKVKNAKTEKSVQKPPMEGTAQIGRSILISSQIVTLITAMKNTPIELSLYDKENPRRMVGYTHVPWSPVYVDYLYKIYQMLEPSPVHVSTGCNVYDDHNSRRIATITLNTTLTHLRDNLTSSFRSLSKKKQNTYMYTGYSPKPTVSLSTINEASISVQETGIIKTTYGGRKKNIKTLKKSNNRRTKESIAVKEGNKTIPRVETQTFKPKIKPSIACLVKSDTDLYKRKKVEVIKTKSCNSFNKSNFKLTDYIFGDGTRRLGSQVYCIGYFTVESDFNTDASSSKKTQECSGKACKETKLESNRGKCEGLPSDDVIRLLTEPIKDGSDFDEIGDGGVKTKFKYNKGDCYCSCDCTFGFIKHTRYCGICGGYENVGEDMSQKQLNAPFPCPIFHKLSDKNKQKTTSTSGSDKSKTKGDDRRKGSKSITSSKSQGQGSEIDNTGKKKKKQDKFKFNYGYTAPQLGHINCALPCTGSLGAVPKNMGWLWTAETVPGLKFRPAWRPGASNKHVVRLLTIAKHPGIMTKKKKKEPGRNKRPLKRPLLTVAKKDGEYTVTMETMKTYSKQRSKSQHPYEDKPVVTYTVGRTEEENRERRKKKERRKRRLERDQRAFIESAFSDMCNEICLKTYQQALGLLPDTEDPDCACYPKHPGPEETNLDVSCSCTEDNAVISSDTDSDEWIIEFTPPIATFDPTFKGKKIQREENSTQYTYLDYRVKILDKSGNQVPRYFKGPDGKTQCSDLGGFWSKDHKWLEINSDGFIAPDGRWAPMIFNGPNGEQVDCHDTGKFQAADQSWLFVGIDGYVDNTKTWKFYPKPKSQFEHKKNVSGKKGAGDKKGDESEITYKPSEAAWSCFGDADPKYLSKLGILGHGQDKKLLLQTLQEMLDHGEDVKIPQPHMVPRSLAREKGKEMGINTYDAHTYFAERQRCKHPVPSGRGIVIGSYSRKKYFKRKDYKNRRPHERIAELANQGIGLSTFHTPCFHSFTNTQAVKKRVYERRVDMLSKLGEDLHSNSVAVQYKYTI